MLDPHQLVAARALAGWSQADLAAAANVGLRTVVGLEKGARDTKFSSVVAIVEALRRHGVEFAQGSERYVGGVLVVRGGPSDWLLPKPDKVGESLVGAAGDSGSTSDEAGTDAATGQNTSMHHDSNMVQRSGAVPKRRPAERQKD